MPSQMVNAAAFSLPWACCGPGRFCFLMRLLSTWIFCLGVTSLLSSSVRRRLVLALLFMLRIFWITLRSGLLIWRICIWVRLRHLVPLSHSMDRYLSGPRRIAGLENWFLSGSRKICRLEGLAMGAVIRPRPTSLLRGLEVMAWRKRRRYSRIFTYLLF